MEGFFIKEWESATKAGKELEVCNKRISHCANGNINTYGGFIWKYKDGDIINKIESQEVFALKKIVLQYDLENNFIKKWPSINDASRELNINNKLISFCTNNERENAGGFIWKLDESVKSYDNVKRNNSHKNNVKIIQYSKNNEFIKEWKDVFEINEKLKINFNYIWQCCEEKRKTSHDFIWKFKDKPEENTI